MELLGKSIEFWSFAYLLALELLATIAFLAGGVPVLQLVLPFGVPQLFSLAFVVLKVTWIVSGVAAGFLLYRWIKNDRRLFAQSTTLDTVAFMVMVVTGINTGLAGVAVNVYLAIFSSYVFLVLAAVAMIVSGSYLLYRWNQNGFRLFAA